MENHNNSCSEIHDVLVKLKYILQSGNLDEEKNNLSHLIEQADFLIGKYDQMCDEAVGVITAMADFDFSKKFSISIDDQNITKVFRYGINILNEEFAESAIHKNIMQTAIDSIIPDNCIIFITNPNGLVIQMSTSTPIIINANKEALIGQNIVAFIENFEKIDQKLKSLEYHQKFECNLLWNGVSYEGELSINISALKGKIQALMYIFKFR